MCIEASEIYTYKTPFRKGRHSGVWISSDPHRSPLWADRRKCRGRDWNQIHRLARAPWSTGVLQDWNKNWRKRERERITEKRENGIITAVILWIRFSTVSYWTYFTLEIKYSTCNLINNFMNLSLAFQNLV